MLITEKKITRVIVKLDKNERDVLRDSIEILSCIQDMMIDKQASEMINLSTGEVIEREEFARLRGIINGLIDGGEWVLK